jgi:hypothetical protein
VAAAEVEDLTRKTEGMQLNTAQQLRDKDREIFYLRYALQQQGHRTGNQQLNYFRSLKKSTLHFHDLLPPCTIMSGMMMSFGKHPHPTIPGIENTVPLKKTTTFQAILCLLLGSKYLPWREKTSQQLWKKDLLKQEPP